MHELNMTPEQWNQYFNQHPSPALEYVRNLTEALNAGWVDSALAEVRLKEIMAECRDLSELITKKDKQEQHNSVINWKK